ncbi:alpha/beta fold hydrolase [Undibacterium sp. SXout11W]|uniref:alpha/beta fold hydrolase n=1 Tax=Undibacterium sp. SXout11W TaxID=3413050 RepID=UPI003BF27022
MIPKAPAVAAYPAVIVVHGGGWMGGSRKDYQGLQSLLANMGLASMSIDYRSAPLARFPAQIEDLKCAIRWLHQHASEHQIDPERIGGFGISAGAHLTALVALTSGKWNTVDRGNQSSDRLRCAVLHAPPLDFPDWWQTADPQITGTMSPRFMLNNLFGKDYSQAKNAYKEASPSTYAAQAQKEKTPPLLIVHGEQDVTVPIRASQAFVDQLIARGVSAELMRISDADHFGFGSQTRQAVEKIQIFFSQCLK